MQTTQVKPYIRPIPATWFLRNRHLVFFMVRELTCLAVGGYALYLLVMMYRALQSESAFHEFFTGIMQCKWAIALQLAALALVLFHCVTWFNLTPKVVVVFRGEERVNPVLIAGAHYALWAVVSVVVWYIVFRV